MKRFTAMIRGGMLECLQWKSWVFTILIGNLIYIVITYFLWKSIYDSAGTDVVAGMTFNDTMIYLVLASALFYSMESFFVWDMHRDIQSGKIVLDLIKPLSYQTFQYLSRFGGTFFGFLTTFIPTFVLVYFLSGFSINLSYNLIFFVISTFMGVFISMSFDFLVGTILLYTQSAWGINIMKETVVLFFSGAAVPIAFFPEPLKTIVMYLPFQSVYNTPLQQLIGDVTIAERFLMLGIQAFWLVLLAILAQIWWRVSTRVITVNGG